MKLPRLIQSNGIYILICIANQRFYIGSSAHLRQRLQNHITTLRQGKHRNQHLQRAWFKYGEEEFICGILEYCEDKVLISREQFYIDKFRAIEIGFNVDLPTNNRLGTKYSPQTVQKLKERLLKERPQRIQKHIQYSGKKFEIVAPNGSIIRTKGVTEFARQHGLSQGLLSQVLAGTRSHTRGWRLPATPIPSDHRIRSPNGSLHIIKVGGIAEFARQNGLKQPGLSSLIRGNRSSYRNWTRAED